MGEFHQTVVQWRAENKKVAVATVIKVKGSTYRREGAKMLIAADGSSLGSVSGGCLESDLIEHAAKILSGEGQARKFHYDLTADDDLLWGMGLGCNGKIDVFLEELPERYEELLGEVQKPQVMCVLVEQDEVIPAPVPRLYATADGMQSGSLGDPELDRLVSDRALQMLREGRSTTLLFTWTAKDGSRHQSEVYIESQIPESKLLVFGAGHDALPLVPLARQMGLHVQVIDSRPQFADQERFPQAERVLCSRPEDLEGKVPTGPFVYALVMTHRFFEDMQIIDWLSGKEMAYVGVLGPRDRLQMMLDRLREQGKSIDLQKLPHLYNPAGLDIGGDSPELVALSIVAEITAVRNQRNAGFLRDRKGPIHDRPAEEKTTGEMSG